MVAPAWRAYARVDTTGARPVIEGTDIKVSQVASEYEHLGLSPDEIIEAHPHLTLAAVHAALAFYYDHTDLIRGEWREARVRIAALRAKYPGRDRARNS